MSSTFRSWRGSAASSGGRRVERRAPAIALPYLAAAVLASWPGPAAGSSAHEHGAGTGSGGTPAEARAAVNLVLRAWDAAANAKDAAMLLRLYDPADSLLLARVEQEAAAMAGLDTLAVTSRVGSLSASGDTVEAVVFRRLTYRQKGREQCWLDWNTVRLLEDAGDWRIVGDDERAFARTVETDLHVKLDPRAGRMEGEAVLRVEIVAPGEDNLHLGLNRGLRVTEIAKEAGASVPFERIADEILVREPASLSAGDVRVLTVRFEGTLFNETREYGYSQVGIGPEGCFASWVTRWYPHLMGSGSKSRGRIVFDVPAGEIVAASGWPAGRTVHGNREEQAFEVRVPVDFSFGVGRYFHREQTVDGVSVGVYLLAGGEEKAALYVPALARLLRFQRDLYGEYPFDSYAIVEIPSSAAGNLGGSSEQGMNLFPVGALPDSSIPLPLLAHEMGHSWWGNLVRGKEGTAIDEALAQTTAALSVREIEGEESMRRFLHRGRPEYGQSAQKYFREFAGRADRDLPLASACTPSTLLYLHELADVKGHFVYVMLREAIGPEAFTRGLRAAVSRFAGKEISLRDLQEEWESASGRDLDGFFRQWFHRAGAPDLVLRYEVAPAGQAYEVSGVVSQAGEPYAVRVDIAALRRDCAPDSAVVHAIEVSGPETPFSFEVAAKPDTVILDQRYKLFRWTEEFHGLESLNAVHRLRSAGRADSAVTLLTECAAGMPGEISALYQLGLCYQDLADLARAESCFRRVRDRGRLTGDDNPVVFLSALHLGQVADLAGRRDEAKGWYSEVLAGRDEQQAHAEARAGLASPYVAKVRAAGPDRRTLAALTGSYAAEGGLSVDVALDADSMLTVGNERNPPVALEWLEGLKFIAPAEGLTFLFAEGAPCPAVELEANGRVMRMRRTE